MHELVQAQVDAALSTACSRVADLEVSLVTRALESSVSYLTFFATSIVIW